MVDAPKPDAPKPALKKPLDDDGLDKPVKKFGKPAGTGKHLGRGILLGALFIMIAWVFASLTQPRYVLAPAATSENTFIYKLDQRTGTLYLCSSQACTEVPTR